MLKEDKNKKFNNISILNLKKRRLTKYLSFFTFLLILAVYRGSSAFSQESNFDKSYSSQIKYYGAEKLKDELTTEAENTLNDFNITSFNPKEILNLTPNKVFEAVFSGVKSKSPKVLKSISAVLGVMLLIALFSSFKLSDKKYKRGQVIGAVASLCIIVTVVEPIIETIFYGVKVIKSSCGLLNCYIPIMGVLMVGSGQKIMALPFSTVMLAASNIVMILASNILAPGLSILLSLGLVSSISEKLNMSGVVDFAYKTLKMILGLSMAIFTGVLSLQSFASGALDSLGTKTIKFMINGCVPLVGSALSDIFLTVKSGVAILKSGVGVFFILGVVAIFLPLVIECLLWMFSLNICVCVGELFELKKITELLGSTEKVVRILLAIVLCVVGILIISTMLLLLTGAS